MNIIELAKQAGFQERNGLIRTMHSTGAWVAINEELTRFASLVRAAALEEAAGVCEKLAEPYAIGHREKVCAATIRALKQPAPPSSRPPYPETHDEGSEP